MTYSEIAKYDALNQVLQKIIQVQQTITINITETSKHNFLNFHPINNENIIWNTLDTISSIQTNFILNFELPGILQLNNQITFADSIDLIKGAAMAHFKQQNLREIINQIK
eukprot:EST42233.1 Hypothetical protein SS50377_18535 [Spironucleus salmonicida]